MHGSCRWVHGASLGALTVSLVFAAGQAEAQTAQPLRLPRPMIRTLPMRPAAQPDLLVDSIREEGGRIVADIRNTGAGDAAATKVSLYVAGRQVAELDLAAMRAGETQTVRFDRPAGATSIQIMVDAANMVAESNEGNNRPPNFALSAPTAPVFRLPARPVQSVASNAAPVVAANSGRTPITTGRPSTPLSNVAGATPAQVHSGTAAPSPVISAARVLPPRPTPAPNTPVQQIATVRPTAAPAELLVPTPDESAMIARLGAPAADAANSPALRSTTVPTLLLNGKDAPDQVRCASGTRVSDGVSLVMVRESHYALHFRCTAPSPLAEASDFAIVMRRGASGPLAPGRGPRRLGENDPTLPPQPSRTWKEVSNCLDAFDKYRKGDLAWDVTVIGNYPRCTTVPSAKLWAAKPLAANPPQPNVSVLNAALGMQSMVRDLVQGQRPERLAAFNETKMEEGITRTMYDLSGQYFNLPGQAIPGTIPVYEYKTHFAFLTKDKPLYNSVALQLIDRNIPYDKRFVPSANITVNRLPANIQGVVPKPGKFIIPGSADKCAMIMAPNKLVGMAIGQLTSRQIADGKQLGWDLDGPVWLSDFAITTKQYAQLLGGRQSGRYQLRVAPAKIVPGAMVPQCMGDPSDSQTINLGLSPTQVANEKAYYTAIAQKAVEDQAAKAVTAAAAALPGGSEANSPALIEVIGWLPPGNESGLVMTDVPVVNFNNPSEAERIDVGRNMSESDPARFLSMPHAPVYHLKQAYPYVTWPDRFGPQWRTGQLYNPAEFERAAKADAALDDWYDYLGAAANVISYTYGALQQGLVDGVAYAVTAGQCPPNVPGQAPVNDSAACAVVKGVAKTGLQVAMSAVGLPPTIPNVPQLLDQGSSYFASFAVDTVLSLQPELAAAIPDTARAALTGLVKDQIKQQMNAMTCAQPTNFNDYKAQGYVAVDPVTMCGFRQGSTTSFSRIDHIPTTETSATLFLRVRPNPKAIGYDPNVTIYTNSVQTLADAKDPRKGGPKGWEEAYRHVGYGFQPLRMAKPIKINMNNVPPEGMIIPIIYNYPEELMYWAYRQSGYCPESMFQSCWVQGAKAFWRYILYDSPQRLTINATYRFSNDIKVTDPKTGVYATAPAVTGYVAGQLSGNLGHVVPGLTYAIPQHDPAPGFRLVGETAKSGLPTYRVEASFDMGKEY